MEDLFAMDEGNINNNNDLRCAEKPIYIHEPRMEQQKQGFIPANIPDIRSTEDPVLINDTRVLSEETDHVPWDDVLILRNLDKLLVVITLCFCVLRHTIWVVRFQKVKKCFQTSVFGEQLFCLLLC